MNKIKWGIIGTGKIAHTFAEALKATPDAELIAIASRNADKAADFAEKFGFIHSYGSYAELAEKSGADVVYIATPMSKHYEDSILCLKNGKHVLCEKSVTLNCTELEEILALAKEKNLFFMEAMWMKCRPVYLKAIEWAKSGRIGEIRYIKADFCNLVPYNHDDRLFNPECGGGALLDLAVYPLTLAADFLGGTPDTIISSAHIGNDGIDLSNSILLKYQNGSFASLDSGFEIPLRNNAVISGTEGLIILGDWFHCTCNPVLLDRCCNEVENINIPDEINGYEYEIREVHRCLANNMTESTLVPHSSTMNIMRIMDECRRQWNMKFPSEIR